MSVGNSICNYKCMQLSIYLSIYLYFCKYTSLSMHGSKNVHKRACANMQICIDDTNTNQISVGRMIVTAAHTIATMACAHVEDTVWFAPPFWKRSCAKLSFFW